MNQTELNNKTASGLSKEDSGALKGIAVCLLLFHHLFFRKWNAASPELTLLFLDTERLRMIAYFGRICVPVFVFVTAYGLSTKFRMTDKLSADDIGQVTAKRIKTLMLQYWYVFVIAQLFSNISGLRPYSEVYGKGLKSVLYFVVDAVGLADFFYTPTLNGTWWYMSVAILLPLVVPTLYVLNRRMGWPLLPVMFFVAKGMDYHGFTRYIIVAMLAIVIRDYDLVEKSEKVLEGRRALCTGLLFADILLLAINCYISYRMMGDEVWAMAVYLMSPCLIVLFYILVVKRMGPLKAFLLKAGKHSMGVFLTHTFIYNYFFMDFIYSFRYVPAIWLALFVTSMALAIVLDYTREKLLAIIRVK